VAGFLSEASAAPTKSPSPVPVGRRLAEGSSESESDVRLIEPDAPDEPDIAACILSMRFARDAFNSASLSTRGGGRAGLVGASPGVLHSRFRVFILDRGAGRAEDIAPTRKGKRAAANSDVFFKTTRFSFSFFPSPVLLPLGLVWQIALPYVTANLSMSSLATRVLR
jgi:hypothetical protein